tara:strand:+ start:774 stop:1052 length:279 start_codon:yes stop_codon:yes gene_type:complete
MPTLPASNPKVAPTLRRNARVVRYSRPDKRDNRDAFRLLKHLTSLKEYTDTDFRNSTLGNLMFEVLEHERVQETQWAHTLTRFMETGLEPTS